MSVQSLVTLHDVRFSSSGPLLTVTWLVHLLCSYETMECKFFIFWLDNEEQDGTVRPINALISSFDDPLLEIVSHGPTAITLQHKGARETFTVDLKEGTFRYLNPREGMRGDGECVNRRNPMLPEGTF